VPLTPTRGPGLRQSSGRLIKFSPRSHRVLGGEAQPEPIALETRKDMQMHVKDLLPSGLTIRKEEVDSPTPKLGGPQSSRGELPDSEQLSTVLDIQVGQ